MKQKNPVRGKQPTLNLQGIDTYRRISDTKSRDEMVKKHLKLVSYIASRLAIGLPDWIDKRDLISSGVIGLIDAVNNFDPSRGIKFETYAKTRIRGAIIDELRALDWIPRSTRSKSKEIERAISDIIKRIGRFPTDEEIADGLGWDMDKYYKVLGQVSVTALLSLDDIEKRELIETVTDILTKLSEQERLVIALYYYEELTLREIGMVLDVTESRISQIHTSAIFKIRVKLRTVYNE